MGTIHPSSISSVLVKVRSSSPRVVVIHGERSYTGNGVTHESSIPKELVDWAIEQRIEERREKARRREAEKAAKKMRRGD